MHSSRIAPPVEIDAGLRAAALDLGAQRRPLPSPWSASWKLNRLNG